MIDQPVHRRFVGMAMRRHRERLGYKLADSAGVLECTASKLSRLETGERGFRPLELRVLMKAYGIGKAEQATLLAAADPRRHAGGWQADYPDILPAGVADYYLLETIASAILAYQAHQVPDLLQTPAYAQALARLARSQASQPVLDRIGDALQDRQEVILSDRRTNLTAIISEGALRQAAGDPQIMRVQLRLLAEVSSVWPSVTVQILPLGALSHAVIGSGSAEILRFPGSPELGVVRWTAAPGAEICHVSPASISNAVSAFAQLKAVALDPAASVELLQALLAELD